MNFGEAIEALKAGKKVARKDWNGKVRFLIYVPGSPHVEYPDGTPYYKALDNGTEPLPSGAISAHIDMYTFDACTLTNKFEPGWQASQTDMLGEDWQIVD